MSKVEIISSSVYEGNQSLCFEASAELEDLKLRFFIKSDSHKRQCRCYVEVFNRKGLSWNRLYQIPTSLMETKEKLCYMPQVTKNLPLNTEEIRGWFSNDLDVLIYHTERLLS